MTAASPARRRSPARRAPRGAAPAAVRTVNLAIQGGGAHGAFAWGVLERLLDDERIAIEGISATSSGALNAVALADGLAESGRAGAKRTLARLWSRINEFAAFSPLQPTAFDRAFGNRSLDFSPAFVVFDLLTRMLSPYQYNPLNFNPLRAVLTDVVDFARLRRQTAIKLFLSATNVRTGKIRIFDNSELGVDAVLASGCLPFLFQAVEIDGESYWDGGYMGNPALFPLIYGCDSRDIVVIHINPIERADVPYTASDILNRLNEISFNSSLMREMRAVAFVTRLIDDGLVAGDALRRTFIHAIEAEEHMRALGVLSKLNPEWDFLLELRDLGRKSAARWLARNFKRLDSASTVDLEARYL